MSVLVWLLILLGRNVVQRAQGDGPVFLQSANINGNEYSALHRAKTFQGEAANSLKKLIAEGALSYSAERTRRGLSLHVSFNKDHVMLKSLKFKRILQLLQNYNDVFPDMPLTNRYDVGYRVTYFNIEFGGSAVKMGLAKHRQSGIALSSSLGRVTYNMLKRKIDLLNEKTKQQIKGLILEAVNSDLNNQPDFNMVGSPLQNHKLRIEVMNLVVVAIVTKSDFVGDDWLLQVDPCDRLSKILIKVNELAQVFNPRQIVLNGSDITGSSLDEELHGGIENDILKGAGGSDAILGGYGNDVIDGGEGHDLAKFTGDESNRTGVLINLLLNYGKRNDAENDWFSSIESIQGSMFDDHLEGDDNDNVIEGLGGDDVFVPNDGIDLLYASDGRNIYALEDSSGTKYFEKDSEKDTIDAISMRDVDWDNVCYFLYNNGSTDDDAQLIVYAKKFDSFARFTNSRSLRLIFNKWNSTDLKHTVFLFKNDVVVSPETFDNREVPKALTKQYPLTVEIVTETSITFTLSINFDLGVNDTLLEMLYVGQNEKTIKRVDATELRWGPFTVDGLATGHCYTFWLTQVVCDTEISRSDKVLRITLPGPPQNLRVIHLTSTTIQLLWDEPSELYSTLYTYVISVVDNRNKQAGSRRPVLSRKPSVRIHNLRPRSQYNVSVASVLKNLRSPFAHVTISTREPRPCEWLQLPPYLLGRIERRGRESHMKLTCRRGLHLTGNDLIPCKTIAPQSIVLPTCSLKACSIHTVYNSNIIRSSNGASHGEKLFGRCNAGYEVKHRVTTFKSICMYGTWRPALPRICRMIRSRAGRP